jgi:hypothetical protein
MRAVDAAAETALAELVRAVVSRDLDELLARVERLERELAAPRSFHRRELERQRRAAVLHARAQGMSIAVIAAATGLGATTVARILDGERVSEPERVRGLDGKLYPARHAGNGRNGGRGGA